MRLDLSQALLAVCLLTAYAQASPKPSVSARFPVFFEPNRGQVDPAVRFVARASGMSLLLKDDSAVLRLPSSEVRMRLLNARPAQAIEALDPQPGTSGYYLGADPTQWRTNIPQSARVQYTGVYPGVDLIFRSTTADTRFEYDFVVAPHSDPSRIAIRFEGAQSIEADGNGGIILHTASGDIRQPQPLIYQDLGAGGGRKQIAGRMVLAKDNIVRFELGAYDHARALVIDPLIISYVIGAVNEIFGGIARDSSGNVYVTGLTNSPGLSIGPPIGKGASANNKVFIAKFNPDLTKLYYLAVVGGSANEQGNGIQVDSGGNAYVIGTTGSADFPIVNGAQSSIGSKQLADTSLSTSAFFLKLDPTGSKLVYSTFLGGMGEDLGLAIAVDANGSAYGTGTTFSSDFPVTPGSVTYPIETISQGDGTNLNPTAPFVAKLSPDGGTFEYVTLFGANNIGKGQAIAVDANGNAYAAGFTEATDFPLAGNPLRTSLPAQCANCYSGILLGINPTGTTLLFSTYWGGTSTTNINAIALDAKNNIYIDGYTFSPDLPITATGIAPAPIAVTTKPVGFVAALSNSGSSVLACTYLGLGTDYTTADAVLVRPSGSIVVAGGSYVGAFAGIQPTPPLTLVGGAYVELDPSLSQVVATYVPGPFAPEFNGAAMAQDGSIAVGGTTDILPASNGQLEKFPREGAVVLVNTSIPAISPVVVTGQASPSVVTTGSTYSYVFRITNTGSTAVTGVGLSTTFKGSAVLINSDSISAGTCNPIPSPLTAITCTIASLPPNTTVFFTVTAKALAAITAQAALTVTSSAVGSQTATINLTIVGAQAGSSFQFSTPVSVSSAGTGAAGAANSIAVSTPNVFLLTSNIENFTDAVLTRQPSVTLPEGTPTQLLTSDFNADGVADLAVLDTTADSVTTFLGTSPGYGAGQPFTTGIGATAVAMMNLTGAPNTGMVAAGANGLALFTSNGDGTFTPGAVFDIPNRQGNLIAIAAGSFTNVGFDDLIAADAAGDIFLIPSDGAGGFGTPIQTMADANPVAFAVGDFNGDGNLDIAVANKGSGDISILLGDGAGNLSTPANVSVGGSPLALAAVDFDGNGTLDLAIVVGGTNVITVLSGDGAGGFNSPVQYVVDATPVALAIGDINGDGSPDIAVANGMPGGVSVLLNQVKPPVTVK